MLCIKSVHFIFNNENYIQTDGVAMESPLAPVLADIFMVEFETTVIPKLSQVTSFWGKYVDDTICFAEIGSIEHILQELNKFNHNI